MPLLASDISRLYAAHARELVAYFARRTYDSEAAVDLTAETFAAAFTGRTSFVGQTDEERMRWIYGIARHRLSGFYRDGRVERTALAKLGVERRALTEPEYERIEEMAELETVRQRVAAELAALPESQAQILQMRVVDELDYDEIAEQLSITETTARARVSRALRSLAVRLEPFMPAEEPVVPESSFAELPILDELGVALDHAFAREEQADVAASGRKGRFQFPRGPFSALLAAILLVGLGASTAAATLTVLRGSPIPVPSPADVQPVMTPRLTSERLLAQRAANPGGGAPFALRVGEGETGLACVTVGQVQDGQFGIVGTDQQFRPMPPQLVDGCGRETGTAPAVVGARILDAPKRADVRTVIYGVGGPKLQRAEVQVRGNWSPVAVQDGTFVAALRDYPEDSALRTRLTFAGGHTTTHDLGANARLLVQPSGPAWRVNVGSTQGYGTLCANAGWARATSTSPAPPPVCGRSRGPRDGRLKEPYVVGVQSLHPGDHGKRGTPFGWWNWRDSAASTVVLGVVDPEKVRSLTVRAGGRTHELKPSPGGGFLLFLPPSIAPAAVRTTVHLRSGTDDQFTGSANTTAGRLSPSQQATR